MDSKLLILMAAWVAIASSRGHKTSHLQETHSKRHSHRAHRERVDDMKSVLREEVAAAQDAKAVVTEIEKAVAEAREAVRSLKRAEHKSRKRLADASKMRSAVDEAGAKVAALESVDPEKRDVATEEAVAAVQRMMDLAAKERLAQGRLGAKIPTIPALPDTATTAQPKTSGELTDPDESNNDVEKLVKKTHENLEKKANHEVIISKGMTKDVLKNNGQVAKKLVKESEDKKPNGEEIVDKQANLEIDRSPAAEDPVDPVADAEALKSGDGKKVAAADIKVPSSGGQLQQVFSFVAMLMFTFILVV